MCVWLALFSCCILYPCNVKCATCQLSCIQDHAESAVSFLPKQLVSMPPRIAESAAGLGSAAATTLPHIHDLFLWLITYSCQHAALKALPANTSAPAGLAAAVAAGTVKLTATNGTTIASAMPPPEMAAAGDMSCGKAMNFQFWAALHTSVEHIVQILWGKSSRSEK